MGRIRKRTSKRGTTHQRTKIQQKVSETRRKRKKDAKKNPQWKSKQKKDPGIPSNFPFKDQVLAEIAETRRKAEEDKQRRREEKAAAKKAVIENVGDDSDRETKGSPAVLLAPASQTAESSTKLPQVSDEPPLLMDSTIPNLEAVLDTADVVMEVLDARDPVSFRSRWLEETITREDKIHAFVLNKADLAPTEAVRGWGQYLRHESTTVLYSATAQPSAVLSAAEPSSGSSGAVGLRKCLKQWAKEKKAASGVLVVAVVGIVNCGKSALVNSLTDSQRVPVYSPTKPRAGFSTTPYPIRISIDVDGSTIDLIDTPGLMKEYTASPTSARLRVQDMLLRNKGNVDKVKDPIPALNYILSRAKARDLMLLYSLPAFADGDTDAFLRALARVKGFVKKKGVPDLPGAARVVLRDWNLNKFPFYTEPPSIDKEDHQPTTRATGFEEIYNRHDDEVLIRTRPRDRMWASTGLVMFSEGQMDERPVVLSPAIDGDAQGGTDTEDEEGASEQVGSGDEHSDEAEETLSEDESGDDKGAHLKAPGKRKRVEQLPLPDRSVKPKRVAFANKKDVRPPKDVEQAKKRGNTAAPSKVASAMKRGAGVGKVGNAKGKVGASRVSGEGEAYDFSRFF